VVALDGIDLEIRIAKFLTILGQAGCGKTTLLQTSIAGFSRRPLVKFRLDGEIIFKLARSRRWFSELAFVSVADGRTKHRIRRASEEFLKPSAGSLCATNRLGGLSGFETSLSAGTMGGMRQRVALWRAV